MSPQSTPEEIVSWLFIFAFYPHLFVLKFLQFVALGCSGSKGSHVNDSHITYL